MDAARQSRPGTTVRKPIIGLAGGIGSGKSRVAGLFAELGAGVIDSDRLNREALQSPEVVATIGRWWGDSVLTPEGQIDRRRLAAVLYEPARRSRLEALLHPRIARRRAEMMERFRREERVRALVIDSPLLFETGLDRECDCVVYVQANEATRARRVRRRHGWSRAELRRREKLQKPLDFKRRRSDYRVRNHSDDLTSLRLQVQAVFSRVLSAGAPGA